MSGFTKPTTLPWPNAFGLAGRESTVQRTKGDLPAERASGPFLPPEIKGGEILILILRVHTHTHITRRSSDLFEVHVFLFKPPAGEVNAGF